MGCMWHMLLFGSLEWTQRLLSLEILSARCLSKPSKNTPFANSISIVSIAYRLEYVTVREDRCRAIEKSPRGEKRRHGDRPPWRPHGIALLYYVSYSWYPPSRVVAIPCGRHGGTA